MKGMFDYTVPSWEELATYAFYSGLVGALLAVGLYLIVWNI